MPGEEIALNRPNARAARADVRAARAEWATMGPTYVCTPLSPYPIERLSHIRHEFPSRSLDPAPYPSRSLAWHGKGLRLAAPHSSSSSQHTPRINMQIDIMPPRPRALIAGVRDPRPGWHDVDLHVYPQRGVAGAGRVRWSQT